MASSSQDRRCGYCYQEFTSNTDPKELPCHHVFCVACLQEDHKDGSIQCITCRVVHTMENVKQLPSPVKHVTPGRRASISATCTSQGCSSERAVCYCIQCGCRLCLKHREVHDAFTGSNHRLVPIDDYLLAPARYQKILCKIHKEEIVRACFHCQALACIRCDLYERNCTFADSRHKYCPLDELRVQLNNHFSNLLAVSNNQVLHVCQRDKQLWGLLDGEEIECVRRVEQIKRVRDQQITAINVESDRLIKQVQDHKKTLTNQVEAYNSELMVKKEQLEEARMKVQKWLREGHVTEQISQLREMERELKAPSLTPECSVPGCIALVPRATSMSAALNVQLMNVPTSLTPISQHNVKTACYSAHFTANGDLFVGCQQRARSVNIQSGAVTDCVYMVGAEHISAVIERGQSVYVLHKTKDILTVDVCLKDTPESRKLFELGQAPRNASFLAVSERYIVATVTNTERMVIYDQLNKRKHMVPRELGRPSGLTFLPCGHLLSVGAEELTKYRINESNIAVVWTCRGIESGWGICTDDNGLIYVSTFKKIIYVISPTGVKLSTLQSDRLPDVSGQISIRGDVLAVPGWRDPHLHVFKLNK